MCVCACVYRCGCVLVRGKSGPGSGNSIYASYRVGGKHGVVEELKKSQYGWNLWIITHYVPPQPTSFKFFKLRYILHKIKYLHFSVLVSEFWQLQTLLFLPLKSRYKCLHLFRKLHSSSYQSVPPTSGSCYSDYCNYRVGLFVLDLPACKWNHTVCTFWCVLLSFYIMFLRFICIVSTVPTYVVFFCWICRNKWR